MKNQNAQSSERTENIFNLMGMATCTLKKHGLDDQAKEMNHRISTEARNYDHALAIITEYIEPTTQEELEEENEL